MGRRRASIAIVMLASFVSAGSVGSARAQSAEAPMARADRLFREGKVALEAGHYDEACPKLLESQHLDPGMGTLLALALCHEASGQTGSAWVEFTAVVQGSQKRVDRAALAQQHLATLEQFVSRLTVTVADGTAGSSLRLRLDGADLPQNRWGTPIPVDPGDHTVEATSDPLPPWKQTIHVGKLGEAKSVLVPNLAAAQAEKPPPSSTWDRRSTGWVVGGAGAVALGVGAIAGGLALASRSSATSLCPNSTCANATGVSDNHRAETEAWVADFGVGFGIVGLGAAAYLLFVHAARPAPATATRLVPTVGPGFAAVSLEQRW